MPAGVLEPAGQDDAGKATPAEDAELAKDVGWIERNAGKAAPDKVRQVIDRINKNVDAVKGRGSGGKKGK